MMGRIRMEKNMDKKELDFILSQGEGLNLEFKENINGIDKDIVAFANSQGGRIFIGISDKKEIRGVDVSNRIKSEIQDIARNCDPRIGINIEQFEDILIINVKESGSKPHKCSAGFYLRQGSNSQKLSTDEIREFFNKEGKLFFDDAINPSFSFQNGFDKSKFELFLRIAKLSGVISDENILKNLGVLTENERFKNAGVLFFCNSVEKFFRQAILTCVLYKGKDKSTIIDRKDFASDIYLNYNDVMKFLHQHLKLIYRFEGFGPRKEILEIPEEALKEAVINSIAHRDYSEKGAHIQVDIFDDRVEISNPGELIIKKEEFGKRSFARNPLIFSLLQRIDLVEEVGSGINRIKNAMSQTGLKEPKFEFGKFFAVTLFRPTQEELSRLAGEKTVEKILSIIEKNSKVTQDELTKLTGLTRRGVEWNIDQLKKQGILKRIGPDKGGYWEIIEKEESKDKQDKKEVKDDKDKTKR